MQYINLKSLTLNFENNRCMEKEYEILGNIVKYIPNLSSILFNCESSLINIEFFTLLSTLLHNFTKLNTFVLYLDYEFDFNNDIYNNFLHSLVNCS